MRTRMTLAPEPPRSHFSLSDSAAHHVTEDGWYSITTQYTSKFGGHISLDVNGVDATGPLEIPTTFVKADTVEWRQAHHWNRFTGLGRFHLSKGKQVLTLHFLDQPVFNFDYMDFVKSAAP